VLGYKVKYQRLEERFVYFTRNGIDIMCEEYDYECGASMVRQTQFIAQDPDGYLFKHCDE